METAMEVSAFEGENLGGVSTMSDEPIDGKETEQQSQNTLESDGQGGTEAQVNEEQKDDSPIPAPQTQAEAANTLKTQGLDINEFENEFMSTGSLSEASYKKLQDAGIPKAMVDSYISGQRAIADKFIGDVYNIAGGEAGYDEMAQWAARNVPEGELKAFNHVMSSGNKELIQLAVTGMVSRWKGAVGSTPKLTHGRANASPKKSEGFASTAEMVKAMQDKRYGRDAAYTRDVENKVARSNIFG